MSLKKHLSLAVGAVLLVISAVPVAEAETQAYNNYLATCADGRSGTRTRTYCTTYASFMSSMTSRQKAAHDAEWAKCSDEVSSGTSTWVCNERAYEVARNLGAAVQVPPGSINLPNLPTEIDLGDLNSVPTTPVKINEAFASEMEADRAAGLTIRIPVTLSGLPSNAEMEKYLNKPSGALGGEPYFIVQCLLTREGNGGDKLYALAGTPWVENGAAKSDTLSVRFFDRFADGALASAATEYNCRPHYGLRLKSGSFLLRPLMDPNNPNAPGKSLCAAPPGYEIGHDDACSIVFGTLEKGKQVRASRAWPEKVPEGHVAIEPMAIQ